MAAAESELKIGEGNNFNEKIKEVDTKLASLILELTTGTHQINNISIDLQKIENLLEGIETETASSQSSIEAFDRKFKDMNELIREIQDEMARINNATSYDGPSALQDASDRSETLDADTLELKSILNEAQSIIAAYEKNLINAKLLTQQTLERLGEVERKIDETKSEKSEHAEGIAKLIDIKTARAELQNAQKLTRESLDETRKVSEEAFEQFVKVEIAIATDRRFKLADKTSDISENVEEMQTLVDETMKSLNKVVEQNSDLLKEIEETIGRAKDVEEKAAEAQREVDVKLELIQRLHANSEMAIRNKNYVVDNARFILRRLDNFKFRLEDEIIMARRSMEKFERVSKKVQETMEMIEKIDEKSMRRHESATSAHDSSTTARNSALKNLISSQQLKSDAHQLKSHVNEITDEASNSDEQTTSLNIAIDKLEGRSVDDSKLIEMTRDILARTWQKVNEADEAIGDVQSKLEMMLAEVSGSRSWDDVDGELDELGEANSN